MLNADLCCCAVYSRNSMEEGMATRSGILAWRIPMDRGAWGYSPQGRKESATTGRLSTAWRKPTQHW